MIEDDQKETKKPLPGEMLILTYNLLALAFYTVLCKMDKSGAGFIFDAILIFFHVIFCVIMAAGQNRRYWFLTALLVLIIGFSTCVMG